MMQFQYAGTIDAAPHEPSQHVRPNKIPRSTEREGQTSQRTSQLKPKPSPHNPQALRRFQLILVASAMAEAGLKTLTEPDFTLLDCGRHRRLLVVVDDDRIPEEFWKPQPPKLDWQALIGAL